MLLLTYQTLTETQNDAPGSEFDWRIIKIWNLFLFTDILGLIYLATETIYNYLFSINNKKTAVACKCCNWDQSDNHFASNSSFQFNENYCSRQTDNFTLSAINITTQRHKNFVKTFDYHYPLLWSGLSLKGLTERVIVQTKN